MTEIETATEKLQSVNAKHGLKPMLNLGELSETLRAHGELLAAICESIKMLTPVTA